MIFKTQIDSSKRLFRLVISRWDLLLFFYFCASSFVGAQVYIGTNTIVTEPIIEKTVRYTNQPVIYIQKGTVTNIQEANSVLVLYTDKYLIKENGKKKGKRLAASKAKKIKKHISPPNEPVKPSNKILFSDSKNPSFYLAFVRNINAVFSPNSFNTKFFIVNSETENFTVSYFYKKRSVNNYSFIIRSDTSFSSDSIRPPPLV